MWYQVTGVQGDRVRLEVHYLFAASGADLMSPNELRFRTHAELTRPLTGAGFPGKHVFGEWNRRPAGAGSRELIFAAARG